MTQIIAHRGARSIAPENTIIAAEIARIIGADLWETDINVTSDGHMIIFHDDHLLRTTNAKTIFSHNNTFCLDEFDLSQIQMLDTGTAFIETDPFGEIAAGNVSTQYLESFRGEKVPTLEEVLNYTQEKQWTVNLELKELSVKLKKFPLPQMVVEMIRRMKIDPELIIISSFNHAWLKEVQILFPELEVQALVGYDLGHEMLWSNYCFDTYNINSDMISMEEITKLKNMGKKVNIFTVNKKEDMVQYINAGVDGIFTDYPQIMKKLLCTLHLPFHNV
ncbi:MAG: hypothetical protein HQK67_01920 [Desulfamplus sp.]|nr:hypothetical protein [Desulfamplus sp.]